VKKLKIGISGFGVVGSKRFDCLINHRDAKVVSICDQKFKNQPCELEGVKIHENYRELLKDEIDAIFICMPNDIAPKVTIEALQKGIHVFCEKPPGRSVYDINKVIEVYNENPSLKLMYGFNHRYHDSVVEAQKIIKSNKLGKIINLKGTYGKSKLITFDQPEWRTKRDIAGGGVLLDQGIHMLDLMRLFAGEFNQVSSFVSNTHWNHDVEDNAYALMKTEENIVGFIHSSATQWRHRFNLEINLQLGSIILGGILSGTKSYGAETLTVVEADPDNDRGDPKEKMVRYNKDPSWNLEVDHFIDSIRKDLKIKKGSPKDALATMKLVNRIYYADPDWRNRFNIKDFD
tara:strand:+ start:5303 stop:6340 length:1038 start_codon:yes stop_codon:yes gene_type:complete